VASRKLWTYFQAHAIRVLPKEPLKKALGCFDTSRRLLKWAVELSEFDITFHPRSALKSQVLADFMAESSAPTTSPKSEVDDRWLVYIDGAASYMGCNLLQGIGN
jgi:hypothetical protein